MTHCNARNYVARGNIGYLMRRGASLMRDQLELAFANHNFTFVQWVTLMLVRDDPTITAGAICRDLHHDSGAFARLLDQLEQRGFLKRQRSVSDRRMVQLQITSSGREALDSLLPIVVDRLNGALDGFTTAEVKALTGLLTRLIVQLELTAAGNEGAALSGNSGDVMSGDRHAK